MMSKLFFQNSTRTLQRSGAGTQPMKLLGSLHLPHASYGSEVSDLLVFAKSSGMHEDHLNSLRNCKSMRTYVDHDLLESYLSCAPWTSQWVALHEEIQKRFEEIESLDGSSAIQLTEEFPHLMESRLNDLQHEGCGKFCCQDNLMKMG